MRVEYEFVVAVPVDAVRGLLTDPDRSTACVPGLSVETSAPGEYGGRVRLRVGSTTVTYRGTATVSPGDGIRLDVDGQEARGDGVAKGMITASLAGEGDSTRVGITADLTVTGRLGALDSAVLADAIRRLLVRFGECIAAAAATEEPEIEAATGPEGGLVSEAAAVDAEPTGSRMPGDGPDRRAAPSPAPRSTSTPVLAPVGAQGEPDMTGAGDDDLLAMEARRPVWVLRPVLPWLSTVTGVVIVLWLLRRRRGSTG